MFNPNEFAATTAKPLPLYLLLDISGSMEGDKIEELNTAVKDLIKSLGDEEKSEVEILISIITFGGDNEARVHTPLTSASKLIFTGLQANGVTPMGGALTKAKEMIEDRSITPSRAYRPTIILVSDGQPTDYWENPMDNFINNGRSQKCDRMALSIQAGEYGEKVLNAFIEKTEHELFTYKEAKDIHKFFRFVTMSITARSKSQNPNQTISSKQLEQGKAVTLESNNSKKSSQNNTNDDSENEDGLIW